MWQKASLLGAGWSRRCELSVRYPQKEVKTKAPPVPGAFCIHSVAAASSSSSLVWKPFFSRFFSPLVSLTSTPLHPHHIRPTFTSRATTRPLHLSILARASF